MPKKTVEEMLAEVHARLEVHKRTAPLLGKMLNLCEEAPPELTEEEYAELPPEEKQKRKRFSNKAVRVQKDYLKKFEEEQKKLLKK
jgi:hypothetical protein